MSSTRTDLLLSLGTLPGRISLTASQGNDAEALQYLEELITKAQQLKLLLTPTPSLRELVAAGVIRVPTLDAGEGPDD